MKQQKDLFSKQIAAAATDKEARKQLGWLYLWTVLLLVLTIVTGFAP